MDHERLDHGSTLRLPGHARHANGGPMDVEGWSGMQTEVFSFLFPF
jgi:protein quaking